MAVLKSAIAASANVPATITTEYLASAGNNSLFTRWRPRSHYLSPHSFMNDPCAWGNVSWGHAISKDLFHWTDISGDWANDSAVSLASGQHVSAPLAVFSGTTQPVNIEGMSDGTLLAFATGVHALPTNWTLPYATGTEKQALFTSTDGGLSWQEVGTVISSPPDGWDVTGWRDPSFFPSAELDRLLSQNSEPHYYMVLGSGLKAGDVPAQFTDTARPGFLGPRIPLYSAPASNLTQWTFLGSLWEPAANSSLGEPDITGSYGYNFEASSFFSLPVSDDTQEKVWFVTMGTEGGNTTQHWRDQWTLWNRGTIARRNNGSVEFTPNSGGALDWGISYAHQTWADTRNNRRVLWGWANEDILPDYEFSTSKQFGYIGSMNLPIELYIRETKGVQNCGIQKDGSFCIEGEKGAGATAQTLGMRPLPDVIKLLRQGAERRQFEVGELTNTVMSVSADMGTSYELMATLTSFSSKAGIIVGQSPDDAEYTTILFDPATSEISVVRKHSSLLPNFNNNSFVGHFEPYQIYDPTSGISTIEELNFHIILDGSLLEIWVNQRFTMTARIYPSRSDSTGLSFFGGDASATGGGPAATWENVKAWVGLANAWPERPENTSVSLVWDTPEQTNNYEWWSGY
ncbi:beta-fructofuranosidase [Colletotrichum eremochloae]|nr:beta-fructofuranosidase [Colletotrichum eremochloae]